MIVLLSIPTREIVCPSFPMEPCRICFITEKCDSGDEVIGGSTIRRF